MSNKNNTTHNVDSLVQALSKLDLTDPSVAGLVAIAIKQAGTVEGLEALDAARTVASANALQNAKALPLFDALLRRNITPSNTNGLYQ